MTTSLFKFLSVAAFVVAAVNAATVITPTSLTACQNANIAWSGAQGKVYLSVLQGKDTSQKPIKTFPEQDGASGSLLWAPVDIKPNTEVTIQINDGSGTPNYSSQVTVMPAVGDCGNVQLLGDGTSEPTTSASSTPGASASSTSSTTSNGQTDTSSTQSVNGQTTSTSTTPSKPAVLPPSQPGVQASSNKTAPSTTTHASGAASPVMVGVETSIAAVFAAALAFF